MVTIVPIEGLNAVAWTLTTIAFCLTLGRFYIRWWKIKQLQLDDLFNGLALISLLCFIATYQAYLPIQYNFQLFLLGLGGYDVDDDQLLYIQKLNIANVVFFWMTIYLVKATFLALYWALFSVSKTFRVAWICVAMYTLISFLVTFFAIFWSCGTPSQIANVEACNSLGRGVIVLIEAMWCALNTFGDIITMLLPLGMLWNLPITTGKKLGVAAIAALVVVDILFDILRTVYTLGSYANPNVNAIWALCEPTIAVMICALPTYRSLLPRGRPVSSSTYPSRRGTNTTQQTGSQKSQTISVTHEMDDMGSLNFNRAIMEHSNLQAA